MGWLVADVIFFKPVLCFPVNKVLKGLSYTVIILAAVSLAMYHPQYFKTVAGFKLSAMIVPCFR